ncbi:MAG: cohesin domain-containing protein [Desulfatibacillaceae bacterium]
MRQHGFSPKRAIATCVAAILLPAFAPAWAATVFLDTRPEQVKDHEFVVQVNVDSVNDAYGLACDVVYDPAYLRVVDLNVSEPEVQPKVAEGDLFDGGGADTTFFRTALEDDTPGNLVVGLTRAGDVVGVDAVSRQTLLSIHFFATKTGTTTVSFDRHDILAPDETPVPVDAWNGITLEILKAFKGDLDNDTLVTLADAIVALRVASGDTTVTVNLDADANVDGVIGLQEAHFIMQDVADIR